jgi:hypothetical protein
MAWSVGQWRVRGVLRQLERRATSNEIKIPAGVATPVVWADKVFVQTAIPTGKKIQPSPPKVRLFQPAPPQDRPGRAAEAAGSAAVEPTEFHQFAIRLDRQTGRCLAKPPAKKSRMKDSEQITHFKPTHLSPMPQSSRILAGGLHCRHEEPALSKISTEGP